MYTVRVDAAKSHDVPCLLPPISADLREPTARGFAAQLPWVFCVSEVPVVSREHEDAIGLNASLTGPQKAVLTKFARHASKDGTSIYPRLDDVVSWTGFNRRTVFRVIDFAQGAGILVQVGHRGRTPEFVMSLDALREFGDTQSLSSVTESHPVNDRESPASDTQSPAGDRESPVSRARKAQGVPISKPPAEKTARGREGAREEPSTEWEQVLAQDKRWKRLTSAEIEQVETTFGMVDLKVAAMQCRQWLKDTAKGRAKKNLHRTWLNWLGKAKQDAERDSKPSQNGRSQRSAPNDQQAFEEALADGRGW